VYLSCRGTCSKLIDLVLVLMRSSSALAYEEREREIANRVATSSLRRESRR
jgi:hypothetical protein